MARIIGWHTVLAAMLAIAAIAPGAAQAQQVAGDWHGTLSVPPGVTLRIGVTITAAPGGGYSGVMQSPDQTPAPIPLDSVTVDGGTLGFAVAAIRGSYTGRWDEARKAWVGEWRQGAALPLVLTAGKPDTRVIAGLDGDWTGAITPAGATIRLILHVTTDARGTIVTLDSPDQLAYGVPLSTLVRTGQTVRFSLNGSSFTGTLAADGQVIGGTWSGPDYKGALLLTRRATQAAAPRRPQTPQPPFPYRAETVTVESAPGVRLAGTLTLPAGKGPFPAVVLITGSGGQDRDETILGHKPFAVIADRLTRDGIAVLRMDDRGVAQSTGDFAAATDDDFARDVAADVAFLRNRSDIDPKRIGLIGHSEGGVVAPMVAAKDPRIAFIVLLAGPAVPLSQVLAAQRARLSPAMGQTRAQIRRDQRLIDHVMAAMRGSKDAAEAKARAMKVIAAEGSATIRANGQAEMMATALSSGWMRDLLDYDPRPTLAAVTCPILALNGARDGQVLPEQNLPAIRLATKANPDVTIVELPGLNHLFQTAKTGTVGEYNDIEETIAPLALDTMADWIGKHAKPAVTLR